MEGDNSWDLIEELQKEFNSEEDYRHIGVLTVKTVNETIDEAARLPDPRDLFQHLWYEGELACLFADSNLGKSIFAVQMAEEIAKTDRILLVDCELNDKQFQSRYTNDETGEIHEFPDNFFRAVINTEALEAEDMETMIIDSIETAATKCRTDIIIIDNITFLCQSTEKGDDASRLMKRLIMLKKEHGWSIMVIAHTPKRSMRNKITQNDIAGSKKIFNFLDSAFTIGKSVQGSNIRYVKQVKVRTGEQLYDSKNVMIFEIDKSDGYMKFVFREFSTEQEHLRTDEEKDMEAIKEEVIQHHLRNESCREIERATGISKSSVGRIIRAYEQEKKALSQTVPECPTVPDECTGTLGTSGTKIQES